MAYTAPTTATTGQILTAARWNTEIKANLEYLKGQAGVVTIESGVTLGAGLGNAQIEVQETSASGQHAFLCAGEPGVTYDVALVSFNWKQTGGSTVGRANTGKGASYLRMLANEIDFDLVSSGGTDTRMAYLTTTGLGVGITPAATLHAYLADSGTTTTPTTAIIEHSSSGTPAAGFGLEVDFRAKSSTTAGRTIATMRAEWATATDASRQGRLSFLMSNASLSRTCLSMELDGSGNRKLGFFGIGAIVQPTVTGSRGGNAALASLLTALGNLGIVADSSTA